MMMIYCPKLSEYGRVIIKITSMSRLIYSPGPVVQFQRQNGLLAHSRQVVAQGVDEGSAHETRVRDKGVHASALYCDVSEELTVKRSREI
jgi:hypothetical protein